MPIRFRRSSPRLTYTRPPASLVRSEGERLVRKVQQRTLAGRDERDVAFVPYADGSSRRVDLFDTGAMQSNFQVTSASSVRLTLGFSRIKEAMKATWHQEGTRGRRSRSGARARTPGRGSGRRSGAGGLPPRPWTGVGRTWVDQMMAVLMKAVRVK